MHAPELRIDAQVIHGLDAGHQGEHLPFEKQRHAENLGKVLLGMQRYGQLEYRRGELGLVDRRIVGVAPGIDRRQFLPETLQQRGVQIRVVQRRVAIAHFVAPNLEQ